MSPHPREATRSAAGTAAQRRYSLAARRCAAASLTCVLASESSAGAARRCFRAPSSQMFEATRDACSDSASVIMATCCCSASERPRCAEAVRKVASASARTTKSAASRSNSASSFAPDAVSDTIASTLATAFTREWTGSPRRPAAAARDSLTSPARSAEGRDAVTSRTLEVRRPPGRHRHARGDNGVLKADHTRPAAGDRRLASAITWR